MPDYAMPDLIGRIFDLEDETDLDSVYRAVNERSKQLRQRRAAKISSTLKPGMKVRISERVRPARFAAQVGTVVGRRNTRWVIRLASGEQPAVGASALEVIEEATDDVDD